MKIDYREAYKCYLQVAKTRTLSYPLDVFKLVKSYGIKTVSYSQLANKLNISMMDLLECMPEYGQLTECKGKYRILYNDTLIEGTIRFTLLHELGHYLMKHKSGDELSDDEIKQNENLANCFARNLIAPVTICKILNFTTPFEISNYFNVSMNAAKTRINLKSNDQYYLQKISGGMDSVPIIKYSYYCPPELPF